MRYRNRSIAIRATEKELSVIDKKAAKAKMTRTDFLIRSAIGKEISVIDDLKPILSELRRIGNNINQIAKLANMNKISSVHLTETNADLSRIYEEIYRIARDNGEKKRGDN